MPVTHQNTPAVRLKPVVRVVVAGYLAVALIGALQLAISAYSNADVMQEYALAETSGSTAVDRQLP